MCLKSLDDNRSGLTFNVTTVKIIKHSTIRAINVAIAAPETPKAGAPNKPKIKIAFKTPLITNPTKLPHMGKALFPILRNAPA